MSDFPYLPVFIATVFHFIFFTTLFTIIIYRNCKCCRDFCLRQCGVEDNLALPTTRLSLPDSDHGHGRSSTPQSFEMIRLTTQNETSGDTADPGMVHINRFLGRSTNDPGMEHINQFLGRSVNLGRRALSDASDPGVRHVQHVLRHGQKTSHKQTVPPRHGSVPNTQTCIPTSASDYGSMPLPALRGHIPGRGRYAEFVSRPRMPLDRPQRLPDYITSVASGSHELSVGGDSASRTPADTSYSLHSDMDDEAEAPPTYEEAIQILDLRDADLFDDITPPKYEDVV